MAAVTQHIPPKGFQMVRYYGWYSNRARGERKKLGLTKPGSEIEEGQEGTVLDVAERQPTRVPSKTWRQLIQKVWPVFYSTSVTS
ncbi:MAG: transposase [Deferrisomatales bacterium]|nr:transposase [Deferrisomatales bacterium]